MISCSRLRALCRLNRLGLHFTMEKQEALFRGDISNAVVDRHFVYALQMHGVFVYGAPEETPTMVRLQARYVQMAVESQTHLNKTNQERAKAQALVSSVHICIASGFQTVAQLYLLKACKLIEKAKLRFFAEYGPPAELSDQVREEVSVLSQLIYLENYLFLTLGGTAPVRTAEIEKEFRVDLQVSTISYFLMGGPEMDFGTCSSERTHSSSIYAH